MENDTVRRYIDYLNDGKINPADLDDYLKLCRDNLLARASSDGDEASAETLLRFADVAEYARWYLAKYLQRLRQYPRQPDDAPSCPLPSDVL